MIIKNELAKVLESLSSECYTYKRTWLKGNSQRKACHIAFLFENREINQQKEISFVVKNADEINDITFDFSNILKTKHENLIPESLKERDNIFSDSLDGLKDNFTTIKEIYNKKPVPQEEIIPFISLCRQHGIINPIDGDSIRYLNNIMRHDKPDNEHKKSLIIQCSSIKSNGINGHKIL